MTKIFVSYSHENKEIVRPLARKLQSMNYEVWIDTQDLKGGTLWGPEIVKAIKTADYFLLFVSSSSILSDNVRREVDLAYKHKKSTQIIPLRLEKVEIPAEWDYQTAGIQWIECSEPGWKIRLLNVLGESDSKKTPGNDSHSDSKSATRKKKQKNFKTKSLDELEKELRMNKAHWINAGFSVPAKNFNFTVVYFENQIEAFRNLREDVSELINQLQVEQINPLYGDFLERSFDIFDRTETRCWQIQDILNDEEIHPLVITTRKAIEALLDNTNNTRELLMQSTTSWNSNTGTFDNKLSRLIVEFQSLIIASQELARQLEQVYNLAGSALSVSNDKR